VRGTTVVLVRHAQSRWNADGLLQGQRGPGLSAHGRRQAEVTAAMLVRRYRHAAAIVRSDLPRVRETAAPVERALGLVGVSDRRLRELDLGSWSGREHADVRAEHGEDFTRWSRGGDVDSHGGETFTQVQARVAAVLGDVGSHHPASTVLVFSHGGPIRMAAATALGLPPSGIVRLEPPGNCAVTVLSWSGDGGSRLVSYNDQSHLAHLADVQDVHDVQADPPSRAAR